MLDIQYKHAILRIIEVQLLRSNMNYYNRSFTTTTNRSSNNERNTFYLRVRYFNDAPIHIRLGTKVGKAEERDVGAIEDAVDEMLRVR